MIYASNECKIPSSSLCPSKDAKEGKYSLGAFYNMNVERRPEFRWPIGLFDYWKLVYRDKFGGGSREKIINFGSKYVANILLARATHTFSLGE